MNDEPPRPSASNEELPAAVDSVIARAMAKEPADRYGSGIELVDAIREATAASRSWLGGRRLVALAALLAILVTAAAVPAILLTGGGAGGPTITTVAGVGLPGSSGDGGLATNAQLLPVALAFDTEGQLYVTDQPGRVRRVGERGFIKTVAGTGGSGYSGDGGPVTEAEIGLAPSLATDADGNLYLVQYDAAALRLVSPEGRITTVARDLCKSPGSAVVTAASIIYLVCEDNIVRRIDSEGGTTTIAGSGLPGLAGDGGPATQAELSLPFGIALAPDGSLYIGDAGNHSIRKIDGDGVITTVAGTGTAGYSGDGGPAFEAELALRGGSVGLAVDAEGNVYITDNQNQRVRKIDVDGVITTVAGTGTAGYSGDGGPATEAMLDSAIALAVDADGNLYIADAGNYRVRKVAFE